jgi:hypothetical protein
VPGRAARGRRLAARQAAWVAGLLFLLPFEPRRPVVAIAGFELTLLELAAAATTAALGWLARRRLLATLRRPGLPLALLAAYAGAHLLSAAVAPEHGAAAAAFALRMVAMATFACVTATLAPRAIQGGLRALVVAAFAVALLAVLEGAGLRALDPLLDLFREMPFHVGGIRRASAGSEYPNLAAAFLVCGLVAAAGSLAGRPRGALLAAASATVLGLGLMFTYSRGALVAALAGLAALALAQWRRSPAAARAPALALGCLLALSATFAWGAEVFRLRLASEGAQAWYGAAYAPEETALRLAPAAALRTPVRVTNTGRLTWHAREFHLSYHWYEPRTRALEDGGRTLLPADLGPGGSVRLLAEVRAPRRPGRYLLVWDMVHEHATWFSGQGVMPAVVEVDVGAPGAATAAGEAGPLPEVGWRPGRTELWRLALGMLRERPWTGVGPDNFRRLHGPRAGQAFWDARVYANNTLLEAAATTGLPGALALAGALAALLWRSWRAASGPGPRAALAATLFALALTLAIHGLVDYVLAFTGHYLFFGFLAGAVSRVGARPIQAPSACRTRPGVGHASGDR